LYFAPTGVLLKRSPIMATPGSRTPETQGSQIRTGFETETHGGEQAPPQDPVKPNEWRESAAAFTDREELRQELRKARAYRGRVRSQLREVREAMNNIIGDTPDDLEVMEELMRRESDLERTLEEAMVYVTELESRSEELLALRASSRHSANLSLNPADSSTSPTHDVRRTLAFTETPQEHEDFGVPEQPKVSEDLLSIEPRDIPANPPNTCHRPATVHSKHCDAGVVGKLSVVNLKDSFKFPQHCRRLEEVLAEIHAGEFDADRTTFTPYLELRHTCTQKLLSTLKECEAVYDCALGAYEVHGDQWEVITQVCKKRFAKRTILLDELKERMTKLRFPSVKNAEIFIKDIISINELYRIVHPSDTAQKCQF
ncbi:hypothetical protein FOZ62_011168, partial [Perkinsus olseni]